MAFRAGARNGFPAGADSLRSRFYHHQQGNRWAPNCNYGRGCEVAGYLPVFQGVDTAQLYREGLIALETIEGGGSVRNFPRIL